MADLYVDENFAFAVVEELRKLGHDILTAQDAGQANQQIADDAVLAYATSLGRAVLTLDRRHFIRLHLRGTATHMGIIVCTDDQDFPALAQRIHQRLVAEGPLANKLIRVNRPRSP
jgi:predicted nuclease of predicted toxin-antitoxin system